MSRLCRYVNVRGLDKVSNEDRMYPIRRAILLRALLEQRLPKKGHVLMIDDAVLDGLLTIGGFHHGARSLEAMLAMSRLSGWMSFECAALPSEAQLNLHVDALDFMNRVRHQNLSGEPREKLYRRCMEPIGNCEGAWCRAMQNADCYCRIWRCANGKLLRMS